MTGEAENGQARALRFLTANLWNDGVDPDELARVLARFEIDVACLQEVGPRATRAVRELLPEGTIGSDSRERLLGGAKHRGLAIASRRPIAVRQFPLVGRDGWAARLLPDAWEQLPGPIEIVNVHLAAPHTWPYFPRRSTRGRQLRGLFAELERRPSVPRALFGDFNASPAWPLYKALAARYVDAVVEVHRGEARKRVTWPHLPAFGLRGLLRIDHCFVSGLAPSAAEVVPIRGSDHAALVVDLLAASGG